MFFKMLSNQIIFFFIAYMIKFRGVPLSFEATMCKKTVMCSYVPLMCVFPTNSDQHEHAINCKVPFTQYLHPFTGVCCHLQYFAIYPLRVSYARTAVKAESHIPDPNRKDLHEGKKENSS